MAFRTEGITDQKQALRRIAEIIARGCVDPKVRAAAHAITADCDARDDMCEVEAIFDAVKNGTDKVKGLKRGVRYVLDPTQADFFTGPKAMLDLCEKGSCSGDCDDQTILVASLLAAIGFKVGARAYAPPGAPKGAYSHIYPVVAIPKKGPWPESYSGHGLDTTVPESYVGWEPRKGRVLTYWIG